jgi:hypothetical protein
LADPRITRCSIVHFDEPFAGGFFGFRRSYGCLARIELESPDCLDNDWATTLTHISNWRASRGAKAASITLHYIAPPSIASSIHRHLASHLLENGLPEPMVGLRVDVAVFDPDGGQSLDIIVYPAA